MIVHDFHVTLSFELGLLFIPMVRLIKKNITKKS